VTIAIAPLVAVDGRIEHLIWVADKAEYFQFAGLTTFLKIRSDLPDGLICRRATTNFAPKRERIRRIGRGSSSW
jgi:hypothetical protein